VANNGQVGTAFFHFDTDVEQVARRVSTSLGQLETTIAPAAAQAHVSPGAFTTGIQDDLSGQVRSLRDLTAQLESGRISAAQFSQQFRQLASSAVQAIPTDLGKRLSLSPETLRNALPIVEIARQQGALAVDALFDELAQIRRRSPAIRDALAGTVFRKSDLRDDLAALGTTPYQVPADDASQIREKARLERLAREISRRAIVEGTGEERVRYIQPGDVALLKNLGVYDTMRGDPLLNSILETGRKPAGSGSSYIEREREFFKDEAPAARRAADAAQKTAVEAERAAEAAQRFARFMSDPQMVRTGQYLFSPETGLYGRLTRQGAEIIPDIDTGDQYRAQQAVDAQLRRQQQENDAQKRRADRDQRLALRAQQPFTQSFLDGFTSRGFGAKEGALNLREFASNELSTFGTVARYTALYQALFGIQAAFTDTAAEALDFRDSLTDLNVAMGDSGPASAGLVGNLQAISRLAGENTGAALDAAARGIRAFGDDYAEAGGNVDDAGVDIARASARIALIAGKDLRDATGDVIAIASAFQLTADQANQVVDAVSAAKDFGGDPKQIAQGLANFATTANEAGFTLGEAANALSLVIARTDQSGQAAATRLSRITSILAGTTGRRVIEELNGLGANIDPAASVKQQLVSIARAYQEQGPELQGRIRSALGGTSNLRELIPLLEPGQLVGEDGGPGRIFTEAADQAGRGVEEFNRKTNDLVGLLKKLQGDISAIQVNLFRVGIFDGIGLALSAIEPGLNVLARLLDLIDRLTDSIPGLQTVLGTLLDIQIGLAIANKIRPGIVASNVLDLVAPRVGGRVAATGGAAAAGGYVAASQAAKAEIALAGSATRASAALNTLTVSSERAAVANVAGSRLTGLKGTAATLGPFAAIAAAIGAVSVGFTTSDRLAQVNEIERKNALVNPDFTDVASIREAANTLRANRAELRESQQGFSLFRPLESLASLIAKPRRDAAIEEAREQEEYLREVAKRIEADTELAAASRQVSVFGDDAAQNLQQVALGLTKLKEAGAGAVTQANLLADALLKGDTDDTTGRPSLPTDNPSQYGATVASALLRSISGAASGLDIYTDGGSDLLDPRGGRLKEQLSPKALADKLRSGTIDTVDAEGNPITATVEEFLSGYARDWIANNVEPGEVMSTEDQAAMIDALIKALGLKGLKGQVGVLRANIRKAVLGEVGISGEQALPPADRRLSAAGYNELVNGNDKGEVGIRTTLLEAPLARLPEGDRAGRLRILRQYRNVIRRLSEANPDLEQAAEDVRLAEEQFSEAAVERMEQLRRVAQAAARGNRAEIRRLGLRSFNKEVNAALANNNLALLIEIFERASAFEVQLVRDRVAMALAAARAQLASIQKTFTSADGIGASIRGAENAAESAGVDSISTKLDLIDDAIANAAVSKKKGDSNYTNPTDVPGVDPVDKDSGGGDDGLTAAQRAAQARAAQTRSDDRVGQARVAVQQAAADLAAAKKGTAEYFSALKALNDAQLDLANTLRDVRFTRRRANSDVTDTVQQARIDLAEANAKLRADQKAGAPSDVINQDRIDVKQKQAALESEAFSRRLRDIQIAEQLGDVSHGAYLRYLEREHDRLTAIKNRTRQQTEQLQEIDLAMKAATETMQGQFNLGDIKVPTPYEARRAVQATRGGTSFLGEAGRAAGSAGTTTINNIKIDGTDIVAVTRVIKSVLGPLNTTTFTNGSRKA
jgi:hypothetical protein